MGILFLSGLCGMYLKLKKYVYGNQDFELAERSKNLIYSFVKIFRVF